MRPWIPVIALALLSSACRQAPALYDVSVAPPAISPDRDGTADVARLAYSVGVPANVTIVLIGPDGAEHVLRDSRSRSPGQYEALFGGVVDGRMLDDGAYTVRFVSEPDDGSPAVSEELPLGVRGGDTAAPELGGLTVHPSVFSPNQDGLGDRVAISYRLDEPADVRLWLETVDGTYVTDILEERTSALSPGEPGPHVYDYDAGVDADAPPPPDGPYRIVAEARDAAGNIARATVDLEIRDGGQPRAALVGDVAWSDTVVPLGGTLAFSATVVNVGDTPIRTRGPEPGFVYDNTQTFNQVAPADVVLLARLGALSAARRVRISGGDVADADLDLVPAAYAGDQGAVSAGDGTPAPTRRAVAVGDETPASTQRAAPATATVDTAPAAVGLVVPLPGPSPAVRAESPPRAPSEEVPSRVTICGTVRSAGRPASGAAVYAFEADGDNGVRAEVDAAGRYCLRDLELPGALQRTFARSPGAIRLGLEYDEKGTDIEYPFRWQIGRTADLDVCDNGDVLYLCLPPGRTVTVFGGVRFVDPPFRRTTNVYLALMHEDVRRMHGPYNPQRITIEH